MQTQYKEDTSLMQLTQVEIAKLEPHFWIEDSYGDQLLTFKHEKKGSYARPNNLIFQVNGIDAVQLEFEPKHLIEIYKMIGKHLESLDPGINDLD